MVLDINEIGKRRAQMIKKASELLFVTPSDAGAPPCAFHVCQQPTHCLSCSAALLTKFRWKIQKLESSYFEV